MISRRQVITLLSTLPALPLFGRAIYPSFFQPALKEGAWHFKLSCNLYSFNDLLSQNEISLYEVIDYCADLGFDAIDPTAYYLGTYPGVPTDNYLYELKKYAFLKGLDISGTGVRNDFTSSDSTARTASRRLVMDWIVAAAKLDAPVLRVFPGRGLPEGFAKEKVMDWMIEELQIVTEAGAKHGVMIILQHHNDFLFTAKEVLEIRRRISSDWFGIMVDIGSLRTTADPYKEIETLAPYAYSWQIKEQVYRKGKAEKTDVPQLIGILKNSGYRGYLPLETLNGDPRGKLPKFLQEVKQAIQS